MARGILFFFIVSVLVHAGITVWRHLSGKEKWAVTKTAGWAGVSALVALGIVSAIVVVF